MLRRTSFLILTLATTIAVAQPLYKWVETDGSITFSPNKPPAGTDYETISKDAIENRIGKSRATNSGLSLDTRMQQKTPESNSIPNVPPANLRGKASTPLMREAPAAAMPASENQNSPLPTDQNGSAVNLEQSRRKQRQCQELQKRVVSLERRLTTVQDPDDMDNTVIHMARYQRSFDQHCAQ
ncbi:MAG: DUF4124 domain-containing protein [Granulosicoccus sp.]